MCSSKDLRLRPEIGSLFTVLNIVSHLLLQRKRSSLCPCFSVFFSYSESRENFVRVTPLDLNNNLHFVAVSVQIRIREYFFMDVRYYLFEDKSRTIEGPSKG